MAKCRNAGGHHAWPSAGLCRRARSCPSAHTWQGVQPDRSDSQHRPPSDRTEECTAILRVPSGRWPWSQRRLAQSISKLAASLE